MSLPKHGAALEHARLHDILAVADHSDFPDDTTKFLRGDRTWAVPSGGGGGGAGPGCGLTQTSADPATIHDSFYYQDVFVFDQVDFATAGMWDPDQPTRITIIEDGIYVCRGQWGANETAAGDYSIAIIPSGVGGSPSGPGAGGLPNGPPGIAWIAEQQQGMTGQYHACVNVTAIRPLLATQFIELWAAQKSGAARAIDFTGTFFEAVRLMDIL